MAGIHFCGFNTEWSVALRKWILIAKLWKMHLYLGVVYKLDSEPRVNFFFNRCRK